MKAYMREAAELLASFGVAVDVGLSEVRAAESRRVHGENSFRREKPVPLLRRVWEASTEPMIVMLIAAAAITLGVNVTRYLTGGEGDFLESAGIFVAIFLSVFITVAMEGRSAKAFEVLSRISEDVSVKVLRDGVVKLIPQRAVVVGDILLIETGDRVPADGRLVRGVGLYADESALTGESMPVRKDAAAVVEREDLPVAERINMLYSGSYVTGGSGVFVVTGVGDGTEFGKIARELAGNQRGSTPLQEKMSALGKRITVLGVSAAAVVFAVQLALFLSRGTLSLDTISDAFVTSIVLIVAAVPEGLPTIVAVSLSINIIRMSRQNALVRKMIACETVGAVNVICSDKTGTLTENRMTVADVAVVEDGALRTVSPEFLRSEAMLENFCVNGTANVHFEENRPPCFVGNPTECALLVAAHRAGWDYAARRGAAVAVHVYPFDSEEKVMTTVLRAGEGYVVYTKGSPERVLAICEIDPVLRAHIEEEIISFESRAARVIAFAHRTFSDAVDFEGERRAVERGMTFDGFVAISDPLRADVPDAVLRCRRAGIDIKMLTGDNIVTARAIAGSLGMLDESHVAVEARDLEGLSDEELADRLPRIRVIARSTPTMKMRAVNALKSRGNIVAVTGDGINDAPALKNADVGIAMGISGTEVSKEASDIVLLDDSFATIAKAVQWGRVIYENFQRFLQFQLTVNLSSVIVVLSSILLGFRTPFTALQLLWINLVMDGPPALTLGLEPARGGLMDRRPVARDASIVTRPMLSRIVANGVFVSCVFLAQQSGNFLGATSREMPTVLFTLFVLLHLCNAFNCRELTAESIFRNLTGNGLMLAVFSATFCLQVAITQFGGVLYNTVPLSLAMWGRMMLTALSIIAASELFRLFLRRTRR